MPKAITSTEVLSEFIGNGWALHKIREMVYETGKKRAIMHGITSAREASRFAGDQVGIVDAQIDSIIASKEE